MFKAGPSAFEPLRSIYDDDGLGYGSEWPQDGFDAHVDMRARERFGAAPSSGLPCVALDIGCGELSRASHLSRLGVFDRVVAIDIADRAAHVARQFARAQQNLCEGAIKPAAPIEFRRAQATHLAPDMFEGMEIDLINFRSVAHFLSPPEFRTVLANLAALATPRSLIAIGFDAWVSKSNIYLPMHGQEPMSRYCRPHPNPRLQKNALYGCYRAQEVEAYLRNALGWELLPTHGISGVRAGQGLLLAHVPKRFVREPHSRPTSVAP